jgi:S-DNA-T family DNA segregation ATPase FtsK/SpoIIIE
VEKPTDVAQRTSPPGRLIQLRRKAEPEVAEAAELPAVADEVVDGELVDDGEGRDLEPALPPQFTALPARPIIADWLRSSGQRRMAAKWALRFAGHVVAFHIARLPLYAGKLALYAPRGLARSSLAAACWLADLEARPLRRAAVDKVEIGEYIKLARLRDDRIRGRLIWAGVLAVPVLVVLAVGWFFYRPYFTVGLVVAVAMLGWLGRRRDKPLIPHAVIPTEAKPLTADTVTAALGSLGISKIDQAVAKGPGLAFPAPICRDGPGWRADVDLPLGVTPGEVMERREKLASGLRRPLGCVWPGADPEIHEGRLVLWVGDQDMSKMRQPPWPLAKSGTTDLFKEFPFGTDQRGRDVSLTLMFASMVIGSVPRIGKTFALRLILLAAALDVRAEIHAFDLKGMGDFSALEPVLHRYGRGCRDEVVERIRADLLDVRAELTRRTDVVDALPREIAPESKITPELASRRQLRLHPIVIAIDECQLAFDHPVFGDEIEALCDDLNRRGPAAGIMLILATQRPDAKSIPSGVKANSVLRFCLKVTGHLENDMVLGTGAYKAGVRATIFSRRDLGIGYLVGEGADPTITRTYYVDNPGAERIAARARRLREAAGTLSGHALGEEPETGPVCTVLDHVRMVLAPGEEKVWSETLLERMRERWPERYDGWSTTQLALALKPYDIATKQIPRRFGERVVNNRGVETADVLAASASPLERR